jgi:hypothetical protein
LVITLPIHQLQTGHHASLGQSVQGEPLSAIQLNTAR